MAIIMMVMKGWLCRVDWIGKKNRDGTSHSLFQGIMMERLRKIIKTLSVTTASS
jgi:hypothetical protein